MSSRFLDKTEAFIVGPWFPLAVAVALTGFGMKYPDTGGALIYLGAFLGVFSIFRFCHKDKMPMIQIIGWTGLAAAIVFLILSYSLWAPLKSPSPSVVKEQAAPIKLVSLSMEYTAKKDFFIRVALQNYSTVPTDQFTDLRFGVKIEGVDILGMLEHDGPSRLMPMESRFHRWIWADKNSPPGMLAATYNSLVRGERSVIVTAYAKDSKGSWWQVVTTQKIMHGIFVSIKEQITKMPDGSEPLP